MAFIGLGIISADSLRAASSYRGRNEWSSRNILSRIENHPLHWEHRSIRPSNLALFFDLTRWREVTILAPVSRVGVAVQRSTNRAGRVERLATVGADAGLRK